MRLFPTRHFQRGVEVVHSGSDRCYNVTLLVNILPARLRGLSLLLGLWKEAVHVRLVFRSGRKLWHRHLPLPVVSWTVDLLINHHHEKALISGLPITTRLFLPKPVCSTLLVQAMEPCFCFNLHALASFFLIVWIFHDECTNRNIKNF